MKEFGYKNVMQVPKLERIVLNVGMGEAIQNVKLLESAATELGTITGQKAVVTKAKKAIAGFKLRQGMPIGTKVTLRSRRMYEFFDRLVSAGAAAHSRFPRRVAQGVRRPRQLYVGSEGAVDFPGDPIRRGRLDSRDGYHDRDDGAYERRRESPAQPVGHAVPDLTLNEGVTCVETGAQE